MTQVFLQAKPPGLGFNTSSFSDGSSDVGHMHEMPQFSFPVRPSVERRKSNEADNTMPLPISASSRKGHHRARTSVNIAPAPLPAFTFGSSSSDHRPAEATPLFEEPSSEAGRLTTTPSGRHRRAVSEFIGEQSAEPQDQDISKLSIQPASGYRSTRGGHRHRRSGAVSQDLSSLAIASGVVAEAKLPQPQAAVSKPISSDFDHDTSSANMARVQSDHSIGEESMLAPRTVTFSDQVDTIQLRPNSMVSSESSSSQSTIRGTCLSYIDDSPSPPRDCSLDRMSVTEREYSSGIGSAPELAQLGTGIGIVELDENFDLDPTAASTVTTEYGDHLPPETFTSVLTQPSSSISPTKAVRNSPSTDIDLDMASVDMNESSPTRTSLRGSGFKKARASMHSAGSQSGLLASTVSLHRRTESAPSLTPVPFSLRSHENAADAGFVMTDVFEEDEEEDEVESTSMPSSHAVTPSEDRHSFVSSLSHEDVTPKPLVGTRATQSSPTLLPPIQFDAWRSRTQSYAETREPRDESNEFSLPRPPFIITQGEQCPSSRSSPRYAQSGLSSCEPSPSFQHSADDVPSLISSGSTVGEATLPNPSVRSFDPSVKVAPGSRSSVAPGSGSHRKRLSVMSMSVSRLFTGSSPAINQAEHFEVPRSQSTVGLEPPKTTKTKRLSRMLKFWKKPQMSPYT